MVFNFNGLKCKCFNDGFVYYKHAAFHLIFNKILIAGQEWCGLLVDYCEWFYQQFKLSF